MMQFEVKIWYKIFINKTEMLEGGKKDRLNFRILNGNYKMEKKPRGGFIMKSVYMENLVIIRGIQ